MKISYNASYDSQIKNINIETITIMKTTLKKFIQNYCNDNKLVLIDNQFLDDCVCNIEINSNEITIKSYKKYTYIKYRGLKYVVKIIDSMFIILE